MCQIRSATVCRRSFGLAAHHGQGRGNREIAACLSIRGGQSRAAGQPTQCQNLRRREMFPQAGGVGGGLVSRGVEGLYAVRLPSGVGMRATAERSEVDEPATWSRPGATPAWDWSIVRSALRASTGACGSGLPCRLRLPARPDAEGPCGPRSTGPGSTASSLRFR